MVHINYKVVYLFVVHPTPRNALSVGSLARSIFYAHLTQLLYFSNLANSISPKLLPVFLTCSRDDADAPEMMH